MSQNPHPSPYKSTGGLRRILNALRYSLQGLQGRDQVRGRLPPGTGAGRAAHPRRILPGPHHGRGLLLIGTVILVLAVELVSSAIEALADALSVETHPLLGRARTWAARR